MQTESIQIDASPEDVLIHWPVDRPLAAWWSGWAQADPHARWLLLAQPSAVHAADAFSLPTPGILPPPAEFPGPLGPGYLLAYSYDVGRGLEPLAQHAPAPRNDRGWPVQIMARCDAGLAYDRAQRRWHAFGQVAPLLAELAPRLRRSGSPRSYSPGTLASTTGREAFIASVARAREYIAAGDIYQSNLAHRLTTTFSGSSRSLFADLARIAAPRFGAYLEFDLGRTRRAVACVSPELLLRFDPVSRRVESRPMKGTRPGGADPAELERNPKDRAELAMITDLMRNDLGRSCRLGSVRVDQERVLERHGHSPLSPGVWQAISVVSGELAPGASLADVLRACLPGGSVTGAPKIRAMQIIDELEPVQRGLYCGSIGYLADSGHATFNVAIRTATITGSPKGEGHARDAFADATLDYSVGAGIVADSDPASEWEETLAKASVLRTVLGPGSIG